jgi:hypothetical protein
MSMAQLPLVVGKHRRNRIETKQQLKQGVPGFIGRASKPPKEFTRADVVPGGIFPNYELLDHNPALLALSQNGTGCAFPSACNAEFTSVVALLIILP